MANDQIKPQISPPPPLPGEAAPDRFSFISGAGDTSDGGRAVFPIVRSSDDGSIDLLGTGFFIANNGIFATARHVLDAPFDRHTGKQLFPVALIHFHEEGRYMMRPILRYAPHGSADVAVGVAAPMTRDSDGAPLLNKILTLNTQPVSVGSHVMTYAYPRYKSTMTEQGQIFNVSGNCYDGKIVEHLPFGRDRVLLPGPCYRTNISIHHGASGGPVFSKGGRVFALNSTGFDGTDDSYVSSIGAILDLSVDDVAMGIGQAPRSVSIREMAEAGFVKVDTQPPAHLL